MSKIGSAMLDKLIPLGTMQRRHRQKKEMEEMRAESIHAIHTHMQHTLNFNSNCNSHHQDHRHRHRHRDHDSFELAENESRSVLAHSEQRKLEPLQRILVNWINAELGLLVVNDYDHHDHHDHRDHDERPVMIVRDLCEDLHDGHVLQRLVEKLSRNENLSFRASASEQQQRGDVGGGVALGELSQKASLKSVLDFVEATCLLVADDDHDDHDDAKKNSNNKWTVDTIYNRDPIAILHLLVALVRHYRSSSSSSSCRSPTTTSALAIVSLPEDVVVNVIVIQKRRQLLEKSIVREQITLPNENNSKKERDKKNNTKHQQQEAAAKEENQPHATSISTFNTQFTSSSSSSSSGSSSSSSSTEQKKTIFAERDAFDTLFDHAPEKLDLVKQSLLTFLHKHLDKKLSIKVTDLDTQLNDGVCLIMLMALLENYFVRDTAYHKEPQTYEQKLDNCKLAFELIDEAGVPTPNCTPEEIASGNLKSILRILYLLFSNFKDRD